VVEREIKLEYPSVEAARAAVGTLGLPLKHPRRLQDDALYDTPDRSLRARACALRLRLDGTSSIVTFKGPPEAGPMKVRPEFETTTGDLAGTRAILEALGYRVAFRYQKYREEFADAACVVAIDETPVGVFVELEGQAERITALADALGFVPAQYLTSSYARLHAERGPALGLGPDMLFPGPGANPERCRGA
jgi:adenylate cyclase class 2